MGNTKRKLLGTLVVLGVLGSLATFGTFSAFTATTSNTGNQFSSGTVKIDDASGATTALFANLTGLGPGSQTVRCIRIAYGGSITPSAVKLYISAGAPSVSAGDKYTLKVERSVGATGGLSSTDQTARTCASFNSDRVGGDVTTPFNADIGTFPTVFADGIDGKESGTWAQNEAVDYRFTLTVKDDDTENAHTTTNAVGPFSLTWKATS